MDYDATYAGAADVFGSDPDPLLPGFCDQLDASRPVLDLGAGQGRNALYLARRGLSVHAVEPSRVGAEAMDGLARAEALPVETFTAGFADFAAPAGSYGGVLVLGLIQILTWDEIALLQRRIDEWTTLGSLVFATAFLTSDATYADCAATWQVLGRNSFRDACGEVATYLEPGELAALFAGFQALHYWEGLGSEHRHGAGPPERHGRAEAVFRR